MENLEISKDLSKPLWQYISFKVTKYVFSKSDWTGPSGFGIPGFEPHGNSKHTKHLGPSGPPKPSGFAKPSWLSWNTKASENLEWII